MNEVLDFVLCDFKCPLHEKCVRFMEDIDKSDWLHFGKNPYNENADKCTHFISYENIELNDKIIDNILEKIKRTQDADDDN